MSWRDQLRPASFRGVPFKVESSNAGFGRRNVSHEYPLRDTPYAEDLGRKQREFAVEAYILGDDYISQRDELINACETADRGQLIHPYYGTRWVICTQCRVTEATAEGRIAKLSLVFVEAGERKFPAAQGDFASRLGIAGDGLFSSSSGFFSSVFSVADMPQQFVERAINQVNALSDKLGDIKGIGDRVALYAYTARRLATDAIDLVTNPAELASRIVNAIGMISDLRFDYGRILSAYTGIAGGGEGSSAIPEEDVLETPDPVGVGEAARELFDFGDPASEAFSPTPLLRGSTVFRQQEQANTEAIIGLVLQCAIVVAANAAAETDYASYEDAISSRQEILDEIDDQLASSDDDVYRSLSDARTVLIQAVPPPDKDLPRLMRIDNRQTRPSLVIAYDLYDKLDHEQDIIKRNQVEHPGFIPGGTVLEVLTDA